MFDRFDRMFEGHLRHEPRRGSFARTLSLPQGVAEADVRASYRDRILEIRIPAPVAEPAKRIAISKR